MTEDQKETAESLSTNIAGPGTIFDETVKRSAARVSRFTIYLGGLAALVGGYYSLKWRLPLSKFRQDVGAKKRSFTCSGFSTKVENWSICRREPIEDLFMLTVCTFIPSFVSFFIWGKAEITWRGEAFHQSPCR